MYPQDVDVAALNAEKKQLEKSLVDSLSPNIAELAAWESGLTDEQRNSFSKDVQKALSTDKTKRNTMQRLEIFSVSSLEKSATFVQQRERIQEIEKLLATGVSTFVMKEQSQPRKTTVFIKGDFTRPDKEVTCGTPSVLPPLSASDKTVNRLDLARWIASPENPLTARVIINRVWQQYFGRGLVESENDFGDFRGQRRHILSCSIGWH